ncbi:MAG TPA: hypothetical protein VGM37_15725 [Armatimonadota bacterium]|jgi:hypothetical protein
MRKGTAICFALLALAVGVWAQVQPKPAFTDDERKAIVALWGEPGRYRIAAPPRAAAEGPWAVRLTPEASQWFLAYQKAVKGADKVAPTQDATAANVAWETWVKAKLAYDRWSATAAASMANALARRGETGVGAFTSTPPPIPGPIPPDLLAAAGNPPPLAVAVAPLRATVVFPDGETFTYDDHVNNRERFGYYRLPQGTVAYGVGVGDMSDAELDPIFAAGMTPSEARAAKAVSKFEGGFETVNTYDTGFISIGFIQFITGEDGAGSLLEVLSREKKDASASFELSFRRYGLDVTDDGALACVDPSTGAELTGHDTVMKVIEDKRLTAIFQRAGRHDLAFRNAQVQVAKSHYWTADDPLTVTVGKRTLTGKVGDVVKSEAGMATLFDRKVNRGNIRPFPDVVASVMTAHNLTDLPAASAYERDIIAQLKYRGDFLNDPNLGQPPAPPAPPVAPPPAPAAK